MCVGLFIAAEIETRKGLGSRLIIIDFIPYTIFMWTHYWIIAGEWIFTNRMPTWIYILKRVVICVLGSDNDCEGRLAVAAERIRE